MRYKLSAYTSDTASPCFIRSRGDWRLQLKDGGGRRSGRTRERVAHRRVRRASRRSQGESDWPTGGSIVYRGAATDRATLPNVSVGRSIGRTAGRTDGRTDGWTDGRTDGWTDVRRTDGRTDGRTDERTNERTNERTDGRTDGWTDGRTSGRMDGRTDGRTSSRITLAFLGQPMFVRYTHLSVADDIRRSVCRRV